MAINEARMIATAEGTEYTDYMVKYIPDSSGIVWPNPGYGRTCFGNYSNVQFRRISSSFTPTGGSAGQLFAIDTTNLLAGGLQGKRIYEITIPTTDGSTVKTLAARKEDLTPFGNGYPTAKFSMDYIGSGDLPNHFRDTLYIVLAAFSGSQSSAAPINGSARWTVSGRLQANRQASNDILQAHDWTKAIEASVPSNAVAYAPCLFAAASSPSLSTLSANVYGIFCHF